MAATSFTEAQVRRAVKGALDAGFRIGAIEILQDGTIRLLPADAVPEEKLARKPEPW